MTTQTQATAPAITTPASNVETALGDLRKKLSALGAMDGKGSTARPEAALRIVDAAYEGLIEEKDAASLYGDYQLGLARAADRNPLATLRGNDTDKGAKQQVSKFRQFIKVGALPKVDARDVMARAAALRSDLAKTDAKVKSPFDALLDTARRQCDSPEEALTDEQIADAVMAPEPKTKDEIAKLIDIYKRTHKMAGDLPGNAPLQDAVSDMADAIVEAGGELPPMSKDEKEQAEFMAKAAKLGFMIAKPAPMITDQSN